MAGTAQILKKEVAIGVLDFSFMAGSMGSVVGEKLTLIIEHAISKIFPSSLFPLPEEPRCKNLVYR